MTSKLTLGDVQNGLTFRNKPLVSEHTDVMEAVRNLNILTDEERLEVFSNFCTYCGGKEKPCYCWNDE